MATAAELLQDWVEQEFSIAGSDLRSRCRTARTDLLLDSAIKEKDLRVAAMKAFMRGLQGDETQSEERCPKCGSNMTIKTARASGSQFWGCVRYPTCNGIRNYIPPAKPRGAAPAPATQEDDDSWDLPSTDDEIPF